MEKLTSFFAAYGFSSDELEMIAMTFKKKTYKKGDYFVQEGKINRQLAFVESGLFQYFFLFQGEEKTTYVSGVQSFIVSLLSFFKEIPARENIRALTDACIWTIDKKQLTELQNKLPAFKDFYIGLLEWQIGCIDDSRFDLITLNAEQRYQKLLAEEPALLQEIPLQYLASILGVTPRHLSRIRGKIRLP